MEVLCLAPAGNSHFACNPKFTAIRAKAISSNDTFKVISSTGNNKKTKGTIRTSIPKPSALPLKVSQLSPSADSVPVPASLQDVVAGKLIENNPSGGDTEELFQYLVEILASRVYDVAIDSPLQNATKLSKKLGVNFWIKREDMQSVFSFKLRGAYNMMTKLSKEQLERGVITASAGNHAQGVALGAQRLKCIATIVMPVTTPEIKMGGRSEPSNEIFCQFIFPEKPGALRKFLDAFSPRWNISLFHYREQGELDASVLVGFQVPKGEIEEFRVQANNLGYSYEIESLNEASQLIME